MEVIRNTSLITATEIDEKSDGGSGTSNVTVISISVCISIVLLAIVILLIWRFGIYKRLSCCNVWNCYSVKHEHKSLLKQIPNISQSLTINKTSPKPLTQSYYNINKTPPKPVTQFYHEQEKQEAKSKKSSKSDARTNIKSVRSSLNVAEDGGDLPSRGDDSDALLSAQLALKNQKINNIYDNPVFSKSDESLHEISSESPDIAKEELPDAPDGKHRPLAANYDGKSTKPEVPEAIPSVLEGNIEDYIRKSSHNYVNKNSSSLFGNIVKRSPELFCDPPDSGGEQNCVPNGAQGLVPYPVPNGVEANMPTHVENKIKNVNLDSDLNPETIYADVLSKYFKIEDNQSMDQSNSYGVGVIDIRVRSDAIISRRDSAIESSVETIEPANTEQNGVNYRDKSRFSTFGKSRRLASFLPPVLDWEELADDPARDQTEEEESTARQLSPHSSPSDFSRDERQVQGEIVAGSNAAGMLQTEDWPWADVAAEYAKTSFNQNTFKAGVKSSEDTDYDDIISKGTIETERRNEELNMNLPVAPACKITSVLLKKITPEIELIHEKIINVPDIPKNEEYNLNYRLDEPELPGQLMPITVSPEQQLEMTATIAQILLRPDTTDVLRDAVAVTNLDRDEKSHDSDRTDTEQPHREDDEARYTLQHSIPGLNSGKNVALEEQNNATIIETVNPLVQNEHQQETKATTELSQSSEQDLEASFEAWTEAPDQLISDNTGLVEDGQTLESFYPSPTSILVIRQQNTSTETNINESVSNTQLRLPKQRKKVSWADHEADAGLSYKDAEEVEHVAKPTFKIHNSDVELPYSSERDHKVSWREQARHKAAKMFHKKKKEVAAPHHEDWGEEVDVRLPETEHMKLGDQQGEEGEEEAVMRRSKSQHTKLGDQQGEEGEEEVVMRRPQSKYTKLGDEQGEEEEGVLRRPKSKYMNQGDQQSEEAEEEVVLRRPKFKYIKLGDQQDKQTVEQRPSSNRYGQSQMDHDDDSNGMLHKYII